MTRGTVRLVRMMAALPLLLSVAPIAFANDELQGVLINQVRSVAGQAFYAGFFTLWQARDPEGLYTLVISEKPMPQNAGASLITVSYENAVVYRRAISFNASKARVVGEAATEGVFARVIQTETDREVVNPDMAISGY